MTGVSRGFVWCLVAAAALVDARGQTPTRTEPFPQLPDARRVGPFLLDPGFTIYNIGYDDNVFLAPANPEQVGSAREIASDFIVRVGPSIDAQLRLGDRMAATIRDRASAEYFLDFTELNHWDNELRTQFDLLAGPLLLTTFVDLAQVKERPNSDVDSRPRRRDTLIGQGARLFLSSRLDLFAKATRRQLRYTDRDDANVDDRLDRSSDELTAEIGLRFSRGLRAFLRRVERDDDFEFDFDATTNPFGNVDAEDVRTLVGLELRPSAFLSGRLAIGPARLEPTIKNTGRRSFDGTVYDVSLTYRPSGATQITLGALQDAYFATFQRNLYYQTEQRSADLNWYLGSRWGVQAGLSDENLDYPEVSLRTVRDPDGSLRTERFIRHDDIRGGYVGVLFKLTGGLEVGLRFGKRNRDSNDPTAVDDQSYITTTGSYNF